MNYAPSYYIGNNIYARKTKATAVAPSIGRICKMDEKDKRCRRVTERQTKVSTNSITSNGFLNTTFLPRLEMKHFTEARRECKKTEKDFYCSLYKLAVHYDIELMQTLNFDYPYNVALALSDMEAKLKEKVPNWDSIRVMQDKKKTYLLTEERYSTGTTLYYIPVIPIFRMLKDRHRKRNAHLLLSVCSYLYRHADIPYYRQENSYLYWQYDMLKEWMQEDDEKEYYEKEFDKADAIGDSMEQKFFNPVNLTRFKERLNSFKNNDEFDNSCYEIANETFKIFTQYPNESIFRNAGQVQEEPDEEHQIITMDKYISFWADDNGCLSENLTDCINNEFNEYGQMEEPLIRKKFDNSLSAQDSLDFESRLFCVLDKLCYLLNKY